MNVTLTQDDVASMVFAETQSEASFVIAKLDTDGMEIAVLVSSFDAGTFFS